MLDIKFIRENLDLVKKSTKEKGYKIDVDEAVKLDDERKSILAKVEALRQRRNEIAAQIMKDRGIPVIDLYTPMAAHPEYSRGDGYHYTPEGNNAQIQILLPVILQRLQAPPK